LISPLDILYVKVFRDTDFSGQYLVRTDGKITLPVIGDMLAGGLTPVGLASQIKQALSEYMVKPDVNVMVYQVNSKTFTVAGEVNRPRRFPLLTTTRCLTPSTKRVALRISPTRRISPLFAARSG
jgi:polysaccharide export outer membrane protein